MSEIRSKPATEASRKGWARIFGKRKPKKPKASWLDDKARPAWLLRPV